MATYFQVILFSLIGGVVSLIGGILLLRTQSTADKLVKYATPFAAGALLAAVFLDLLPEGIERTSTNQVLVATLSGIVIFFIAEHFLHWFHHHGKRTNEKIDPTASLIIFGDTAHNALDGVAIAASFLISVPTGIITTFAVAAHEIPQEIGDFGLLLKKGMSRKSVLVVNVVSALATVLAAVVTFYLGSENSGIIGIMLGLSAGFLLYIALSDVVPSLHNHQNHSKFIKNAGMLIAGLVLVASVVQVAHGLGHPEHEDHDEEHASVLMCGEEQIGIDAFGDVTELYTQIAEVGCENLQECSHQVSIEGDPINAPCLFHNDDVHDESDDHTDNHDH